MYKGIGGKAPTNPFRHSEVNKMRSSSWGFRLTSEGSKSHQSAIEETAAQYNFIIAYQIYSHVCPDVSHDYAT